MKKKKEETIPFSNYIKLGLIVVITIIIAIILRNYYINNENYEKTIPVIRDVLISEINSDEVYNFIRENENVLLYVGVSDDDNCRKLELELKDVITNRNLNDRITYLNITKEKKKTTFIKDFNKFYGTKINTYPSFILFEEGNVKDILTAKKNENLTIEEVINFLDRNNITSDIYD